MVSQLVLGDSLDVFLSLQLQTKKIEEENILADVVVVVKSTSDPERRDRTSSVV